MEKVHGTEKGSFINHVMPRGGGGDFVVLTQSKFSTITRSVHSKLNCITVKYNGT